jgi:hypothetical protein
MLHVCLSLSFSLPRVTTREPTNEISWNLRVYNCADFGDVLVLVKIRQRTLHEDLNAVLILLLS